MGLELGVVDVERGDRVDVAGNHRVELLEVSASSLTASRQPARQPRRRAPARLRASAVSLAVRGSAGRYDAGGAADPDALSILSESSI